MSSCPVKEGDILAGKYRVEKVLGEGGMGVVVAAWHEELEKRVAVKFLLPEMAERGDAAERFRREARAAVRIQSEHVARVLDVGTMDAAVPYMVMEYLEGHDLGDELSARGRLPVTEAVDYLLQAGEAVAEAHALGIVHRDLKPANLFLSRRADGTPLVKVLDFGISKSIAADSQGGMSLTRTAAMVGSPLYMSPEQMRSAKDVDTRTDIWALGAIFYEMLAGRPPYDAESVPELYASLLSDSPPAMQEFRSDVPPGLERVLLRCLQKDRAERWGTVAELASAISDFGSPESRIHAARAQRVLGALDSTLAADAHSASTERMPAPPPGAVAAKSGEAASPHAAATVDSWGRTQAPASPGRRWLLPVGAVALVLAGAGVMFLFRSPSATASAPPKDSASSALSTQSAPPSAATPTTTASGGTDATAEPDAAAPPQASASAPAASAAPESRPRRAVRRPPSHPRPAPTKTAKGVIPEFGGRR